MKVNLKKTKRLKFPTSSNTATVIDHGRGFLRTVEIKHMYTHGLLFEFYHEDARALRDWLNKVLPNE